MPVLVKRRRQDLARRVSTAVERGCRPRFAAGEGMDEGEGR